MSFFAELKRRNVIRVGIAYVIVAWLVLQFADVVLNNIAAPGWVFQVIMLVLGSGFPLALIFAWAFEMTPEGLKKEKDVDRSQSIAPNTGRKLDFTIIFVLVIALVYFVWESRFETDSDMGSEPFSQGTAGQISEADGEKRDPTPGGAGKMNLTPLGGTRSVAGADNSIAVLPFANRSRDEDDAFFTDGIHDDLLTQLAKINGLKVISRTSVMEYRNTTKKIPEIARELGVTKILEGGVQRAGSRIRINAQLIDVETDEHLWAETFDREMSIENLFDIQSEITHAIVMAVKGEMSGADEAASTLPPTNNLQAYEAYMHARAATQEADYTIEKYLRAQQWAEKAVALDPDFAWAWSILVEVHCQAVWMGYDESAERIASAKTALEHAMATNPNSSEAQTALGEYRYRIESDFPAALEAFKKAAAIQPGNAAIMVQMALTQRRLGAYDDALASYERALELDPANRYALSDYIFTLILVSEWQRASSVVDEAIRRFPTAIELKGHKANLLIQWKGDLQAARETFTAMAPIAGNVYSELATRLPLFERNLEDAIAAWDIPAVKTVAGFGGSSLGWRDLSLGEIYQLQGHEDLARQHLQKAVQSIDGKARSSHRNGAYELINLAQAYALLGDTARALESARQAVAIMAAGTDRFESASVDSGYARVLAITGQHDEALKEIERLIGTPGSFMHRWVLYLDPRWDFFRDDERFNALARPLNLKENGQ